MINIIILSIITLLFWHISNVYIQQTSRRLFNLTYVLFVSSISSIIISILKYIHDNNGNTFRVLTLEYINKGQLPLFLVANIATGIINLSIQTIYTPKGIAFPIVVIYILLCIVFVFMFNIYFIGDKERVKIYEN